MQFNYDNRRGYGGSEIPEYAMPIIGFLRTTVIGMLLATTLLVTAVYGWKLNLNSIIPKKDGVQSGEGTVVVFYDETYLHNGFDYAYPSSSKVAIVKGNAKGGRCSLQLDLASNDYSGGAICFNDTLYDLRPFLKNAALQFWIRGAMGNEKAWVALIDEELSDRRKTVVRLPIEWFGTISKEWSLISIPLASFDRDRGVYWDAKLQQEMPDDFNWNKVAEFRIEVKKDENKSFRVWIDDIVIVKTSR